MFENFKLSKFLSSFSIGETQQSSSIDKYTQDSTHKQAHDIKKFYQDFLVIQTNNSTQESIIISSLSQSNSSYFSQTSNSPYQNYGHSEIMYLKDKISASKFVQVGKQTYDHIAIKLQVFSKKQTQKLRKKLNQQLQFKQSVLKKPLNKQRQFYEKNKFVQLLVNYYIEEISSICSSFTHIYIVFQKWNQGIFQKLNQIIQTPNNMDNHDPSQLKRNNINIIQQTNYKKSGDNKSSNASTFISMKNYNFGFTERKLSPINKIQNINESRYLGKSQLGYQNQKSTNIHPYIKTINESSVNNSRQGLARQLLKMVKNVMQGLRQEFQIDIIRSDLKICDLIYQQSYKLSNPLIPQQVLIQILKNQIEDNNVYNENLHGERSFNADNFEKILSIISYPSPQQLSHIINSNLEQIKQSQNYRKQSNQLSLSSLLFKLGMVSLELFCFFQWKLNLKQNNNKNTSKYLNTPWKSIKDKVYIEDTSYQTQINLNQNKFIKTPLKIDWLQISNIFKNIQQASQFQTRKNIYKSNSLTEPVINELPLFFKVLKSLLNRSAMERNKTFSLFLERNHKKLSKCQSNLNVQQNPKPYHNNTTTLTNYSLQGTNQKYFITSYVNTCSNSIQSKLPTNFSNLKSMEMQRNNFPSQFIQEKQYLNSMTYFPIQNNQHIIIPSVQEQRNFNFTSLKLVISMNSAFDKGYNQTQKIYQLNKQILNQKIPLDMQKTQQFITFSSTSPRYQTLNEPQKNINTIQFDKNTIKSTTFLIQLQKYNQSVEKDISTPYFGRNEEKGELFKFNSVSQKARKKLFNKSQPFTVNYEIFSSQILHDKIDNGSDNKKNSQDSLDQLPQLQQQSPINKKPSTLSKPSYEQTQLPNHIPQSSKQNILFSNITSEIENDNILIQEDNQSVKSKIKSQITQKFQQNNLFNNDTHNETDINQTHQTLKITDQHLHQFQSLQYIEQNQPQPTSQAEYVIESHKGGGGYEGYVVNKRRNGYGKLYYHDGSRYEGEWLQDQMNGYGKLYYSSGLLAYEGNWVKDQFHGAGKVYNDTPTMLDDSFDYSNFNNLEQQWAYYEGQLQHDLKQGHGIIMLQNGEYFEGDFHSDRINGQGKFLNLEGQTIHGIWKDNVLIQLIQI